MDGRVKPGHDGGSAGASFAASSSGNRSRKETPTRGVARISFLV